MKNAIVVGAGMVGLAVSRSLALKGWDVLVLERHPVAVGASIRNFGMVWPIGQPEGKLYERALRTRAIWLDVCEEAGLWANPVGSLHLAYQPLEAQVMQEVVAMNKGLRDMEWLDMETALQYSEAANPDGLLGALWSPDELIIESRAAIAALPDYLQEKFGVEFKFGTAVTRVETGKVWTGKACMEADLVVICNGADFETLYPDHFAAAPLTKCKLQMMRLAAQPNGWRIGPSLCGGLSLLHYKGFSGAPSLTALHAHLQQQLPDYFNWGIHVMVSQNEVGELTIGDSHEYGLHLDPFDKQFINDMILDYLQQFAQFKSWDLAQSWHGIYTKLTNGGTEWMEQPEPGVWVINGLGGAGMTLSFGLAEEWSSVL